MINIREECIEMKQIKNIINTGLRKLTQESSEFEKEFHAKSEEMQQFKTEMNSWKNKRKLTRSK